MAEWVGLVALAGGLVVACGGASGGGDIGSPGGSGVDATVDVGGGVQMVPMGGDDASDDQMGSMPPQDSGGGGPTDTGAPDTMGDKGRDASPVDSGGLDAPSDATKDKGPFACGPTLTCDSRTQYCEHAATSTIIVLDASSAYSCQPLPACDATDVCTCLTTTSPTDTCMCTSDNGGVTRTCSCLVCASP
ncbi:MAG: hypothetical protein ACLP1X_23165 [Polyangiaceae bacterium]|jgi:hypothetical protein